MRENSDEASATAVRTAIIWCAQTNCGPCRPSPWRRGKKMYARVIAFFYPRKMRIAFFALAIYAALCW